MNQLKKMFLGLVERLSWAPGLVTRLILGFIFAQSGWGKLHNLEKVTQFFTSLGIPAAKIQAPFVATVELLCGSLLLAGLFTRFASLPLIATMVVALITAKRDAIGGWGDLFGLSEFLYILLLAWLVFKGGGALSMDRLLRKSSRES